MPDSQRKPVPPAAWRAMWLNTIAFTVCFAAWMMYGVLITFLVDNAVFQWNAKQMGWLIGIPVLTGAIFRLPMGIATDKFGGKPVYGTLLIIEHGHADYMSEGLPTDEAPGTRIARQEEETQDGQTIRDASPERGET